MKPKGCEACSVARIDSRGGIAPVDDTEAGLSFPKTLVRMNRAAAPNIQFLAFDNFGSPNPSKDQSKIFGGCRDKASLSALSPALITSDSALYQDMLRTAEQARTRSYKDARTEAFAGGKALKGQRSIRITINGVSVSFGRMPAQNKSKVRPGEILRENISSRSE